MIALACGSVLWNLTPPSEGLHRKFLLGMPGLDVLTKVLVVVNALRSGT